MSRVHIHNDYGKWRKLIVLAAMCYGCEPGVITGVKDTKFKVIAIYLSQQLFDFTDNELALLFRINKYYMLDQLQDLKIEIALLASEDIEFLNKPLEVYERLEIIDILNA